MNNGIKIENIKYPLRFAPILKQRVWGGNKYIPEDENTKGPIGESWEISGLEENISVVSNGDLAGTPLNVLLKEYKEELLGKHVYKQFGARFPLLFKFIDAEKDLSVQLHPNDDLAKERHNSFGKTEMWYIIDADEDAELILGFNQSMNKEKYKKYLEQKRIAEIVQYQNIKKGEAYLVESGTVHAICKGVFLAEVQQASDITYRIYDWDRLGVSGQPRDLHTELALDAIDFTQKDTKLVYKDKTNDVTAICNTPYFNTNKVVIDGELTRDLSKKDSFVVYMCVKGQGEVYINGKSEEIMQGESFLIPAVCDSLKIKGKDFELLEVYIPEQV